MPTQVFFERLRGPLNPLLGGRRRSLLRRTTSSLITDPLGHELSFMRHVFAREKHHMVSPFANSVQPIDENFGW
jgi:hypothetical protein